MFFSKPQSYLGIDLGAGGVKLVELKKEKNRPLLYTYGLTSATQDVHRLFRRKKTVNGKLENNEGSDEVDAAGNPIINPAKVEQYAQVLKAVCKAAHTSSKNAVVSLPVSVLFHAVINLPPLKKEELDGVLKAEIKKLLPRPIEEMALDYQVLSPAPGAKSQRVLVNAVPRDLVMFYTQVFKRAGLALDSLEPESVALARSLVGKDNSVAMLIDVGAERSNFFIIDQGVAITHHSVEIGGFKIDRVLKNILNVEDLLVEQMKRDLFSKLMKIGGAGNSLWSRENFAEMFQTIINPIIKEIEYGFEIYLRQTGNEEKRPEKVILTGGAGQMPYLADIIAEKFKLKCYVGDPWGRVVYQDSIKPVLSNIGSRMAVAVGLALRNVL